MPNNPLSNVSASQFKSDCKAMLLAEIREHGPINPRAAGKVICVSSLTALDWLRQLCTEGKLVEWEINHRYSLFGEAPQ